MKSRNDAMYRNLSVTTAVVLGIAAGAMAQAPRSRGGPPARGEAFVALQRSAVIPRGVPNQAAAANNAPNPNTLDRTPGATIPLGPLVLGNTNTNFNNTPWFLPFGYGLNSPFFNFPFGIPYGPNGFGYTNYGDGYSTNGYYGVGSGGYGPDNLAGSGLYTGGGDQPAQPAAVETPLTPEQQRQSLENAQAYNRLYYQFREANRAYRLRQIARDRASPETQAKVALDNLPRRLGPDELDPASGRINWPEPLQGEEFATLRTGIEQQFSVRNTSQGKDSSQKIKDQVELMLEILRSKIETMPADEYIGARKFLDSLEFAVHRPSRS
jgi:hypothetical protein